TTYLPGTTAGSIGRTITSVSKLNSIIDAYNANVASKDNCVASIKTDPVGNCLRALAHIPNGVQLGGDSLISQDVRITKSFHFTERTRLDLTAEIFNIFNIANLTTVNDIAIPAAQDVGANPSLNDITTFKPTERVNNVFG